MNKKKLLALLMALVMTLTLVPVTALAEEPVNTATLTQGGVTTEFQDFGYAYQAIDESKGEAVITLLADHNYNCQMRFEKPFTLDLNGHTLKNEYESYPFITAANLVIQDTSASGNGVFLADKATNCALAVVSGATVTLKSGTIQSETAIFAINANGTVNIEGGKVVSYSKWGTGDSRGLIFYAKNTSYLNISGGEFRSDQSAKSWDFSSFDPVYYLASNNLNEGAVVTVTGGTFSGKRIQKYVPGYTADQEFSDANPTITVGDYTITRSTVSSPYGAAPYDAYLYTVEKAKTYVAQIGSTKYETLAEAVAAVPANGTETTITMIADYEAPMDHADSSSGGYNVVNIAKDQNVILDLNSKTITGVIAYDAKNSAVITVSEYGTLTIRDSSAAKTGTITHVKYDDGVRVGNWSAQNWQTDILFNHGGTLTIEGGTIANTANGNICYAIDNSNNYRHNDATLTITGGTITSQYCDTIRMRLDAPIYGDDSSRNIINVSGGTISGKGGIWAQVSSGTTPKGRLNISGGSITGGEWGTLTYYAGTGVSIDDFPASISGGKIAGSVDLPQVNYISGGVFSEEIVEDTVAEGLTRIANTDEDTQEAYPYTVGVKAQPVAEVNGTQYTTLEAAVAAAPSGATVKLIDDIDYSTVYTVRNARDNDDEHAIDLGNLTLDMDNHSISTINATVVFGGNGATIKNGTFSLVPKNTDGSYKDGSYALIIDNAVNDHGASGTVLVKNVTCEGGINLCSADVTLDNVTASTTPTKFYAVWAEQNAKVTILGGTYTDTQSKGKGVLATGKDAEGGAKIYVTGGYYNAVNKLVYSAEANSIQITGGIFTKDPTTYVADGYEAVADKPESGKWQVGKVVEIEVATPAVIEDNNVTYEQYSQTKEIVDENTDTAIGETHSITVNVKPTTAESAKIAAAALNNITTDAKETLVKAAVAEAPNNANATVDVTIQVAKDKDYESSTENAVVYNVHPQAIITVQGSETSTTVELTNEQLSAGHSFNFYLDVSSLDVETGEQVAVNHIHEDGTEESLGWRHVGSTSTVSVTGITSFSEFKVQKITTTIDNASVTFNGASLRRRVKLQGGNETNEVVNTSADIRMEYSWTLPTGAVIDKTNSYFQWRAADSGLEWHSVAIAKCSATGANLVLTGVKRDQFSVEIETKIHIEYKIGNDPYVLNGTYTNASDRRSVESTASKLIATDGVAEQWKDYARYLLTGYDTGYPYNVTSYTILRDQETNAIIGYEKTN